MARISLSHVTIQTLVWETRTEVRRAAQRLGVDEHLALAVAQTESALYPFAIRIEPGLESLGWFRSACEKHGHSPEAWRSQTSVGPLQILLVNCWEQGWAAGLDPLITCVPMSVLYGVEHLRTQLRRYDGDVADAVSAYNAGHATQHNRSAYVEPTLAYMEEFKRKDTA